MAQETGFSRAHFWRCRAGQQAQTHGWVCVDPVKAFVAVTDHTSRVGNAAATRIAENAAAMGMTVEQYNQLSYSRRSRLRKVANPLEVAIAKGWLTA